MKFYLRKRLFQSPEIQPYFKQENIALKDFAMSEEELTVIHLLSRNFEKSTSSLASVKNYFKMAFLCFLFITYDSSI